MSEASSVFTAVPHCSPIAPRWDHLVAGKKSSWLPLILHYGDLYNHFMIYHSVVIMEMKCTINVMQLNHPKIIPLTATPLPPSLWKNHLPRNWSLVPKRLGTAALG